MENNRTVAWSRAASKDLLIAGSALLMLLAAQWALSAAIHGTNYYGFDGKMAQATVLAAFKYAGLFQVTTLSPIEGVGSQLLTMNVWANPAYWPFAFFDREVATDVSALVALGIFTTATFIMARCCDVPIVPSAIASQLCIVLFAPALLILLMPTNFCLTPGNGVAYAPHMVALGLLSRIEPGSWRHFAAMTGGIFALLLFGLYVDPLWSMVSGFSWAVAFGIVTIGPFRRKPILLRASALGCCVMLLVITGAAGYAHIVSQYTARVQYSELVDRLRTPGLVSALVYSPNMKYLLLCCMFGWFVGLLTLRGRPWVLVLAATASFLAYAAYSTIYLLWLNAVWVPPIPVYLEHSLFMLYITGAVTGYWGILQTATSLGGRLVAGLRRSGTDVAAPLPRLSPLFGLGPASQWLPLRAAAIAIAFALVTIIPARVTDYALHESAPRAEIYHEPWPDEPELMQFFARNLSSDVGQPLRGSLFFSEYHYIRETGLTMANAWAHGLHTVTEYSQLVTPPAVYFLYAFLQQHSVLGSLNGFVPIPGPAPTRERFGKAMQLLGVRYFVSIYERAAGTDQGSHPPITLPRRLLGKEPGLWYIYEYPRPNAGNYSPIEIVTAGTAAEIVAKMGAPDFDFTKQAVVSERMNEPLVEARGMQLSRIRGGFRASGHSDGTSLIILPLQYSHCLRARDAGIRFVRADLMMAGMIFSGDIDTDIAFDFGIFSPACRRLDLADFKRLDMKIDLRAAHLTGDRLFPDWDESMAKLRAAGVAFRVLKEAGPSGQPEALGAPEPEPQQ
jgi:hypothetical protein